MRAKSDTSKSEWLGACLWFLILVLACAVWVYWPVQKGISWKQTCGDFEFRITDDRFAFTNPFNYPVTIQIIDWYGRTQHIVRILPSDSIDGIPTGESIQVWADGCPVAFTKIRRPE